MIKPIAIEVMAALVMALAGGARADQWVDGASVQLREAAASVAVLGDRAPAPTAPQASPRAPGAEGSTARRYLVSQIRYTAEHIEWIDDESLVFMGFRTPDAVPGTRVTAPPSAVYRWNTRTGEVTELTTAGEYGGLLCYDRGYLVVAFDRGNDRVVRQGPIGHVAEITYKKAERSPFAGEFNRYTCKWRDSPRPTNGNSKVIQILRDDHGYIESEKSELQRNKYFLVQPSGHRVPVDLPQVALAPRFSSYLQAYVFQYGGSDLSSKADKRIWTLGLDGTLTDHRLPKGPWLGGAMRAMPVRGGILLTSPSRMTGDDGAYLVTSGRVERIITGVVDSFAVLSDGCRVAMSVDSGAGNKVLDTRTILIDICKGAG